MRAAVLGNGQLHLGWDGSLRLREVFWPRVGMWNHVQENSKSRLVLWHDRRLYDLIDGEFISAGRYASGMGFQWAIRHKDFDLEIAVADWVDPYLPVWARKVRVSLPRDGYDEAAGVYSVQAFALGENTVGEEAVFDPGGRLYHFKGPVWLAAQVKNLGAASLPRAAVAKTRDGGVRFSSELGLAGGPQVEHGLVESALGISWEGSRRAAVEFMFAFGRCRAEADDVLDQACDADAVAARSRRYWGRRPGRMAAPVSARILAAHCDDEGGILASCDGDILGDHRDHYRYVWPRDAAMCASALLRAGFPKYARRYLKFCSRTLSDGGFFMQRYRSDGTVGSGWHPWLLGPPERPIQEDETALSLVTAGDYLEIAGDLDALNDAYLPFVRKAARFIMEYATEDGTLVLPSYDLWEERRGIFSFTQASCVAGLLSAAKVAGALCRRADYSDFLQGAASLLSGLAEHLSEEDRGYCRCITGGCREGPGFERDWTADSSLFLVPLLLPSPDAPCGLSGAAGVNLLHVLRKRSVQTWERLKRSLAVKAPGAESPGYARYAGDWYCRPSEARGAPGNPWLVSTAWFALSGFRLGLLEREEAGKVLLWFQAAASPGGIMPEQLNCLSGEPLSVAPLSWSHAMHLELLSAFERGTSNTTPWTGAR